MQTHRFSGLANIYAKYRPSYPTVLFDDLYSRFGLTSARIVADVGAGTGIFSLPLLERGSTVYCVEPNADMATQLTHTLSGFPNAHHIAAPAEATTLPAISVHAVTAAQAFHWFDRAAFLLECRRILRPGGFVLLVWNQGDPASHFMQAQHTLEQQFCENPLPGKNLMPIPAEAYDDFFARRCDHLCYDNAFITDEENYVGRQLSSSTAPREDDPRRETYAQALRELFRAHASSGELRYPNLTKCYIGPV